MSKRFTKQIEKKLISVLKIVFPKKKKFTNINRLKINSFQEWDSIGNLNLLLAIEKEFSIKFSYNEMSEIKSIRQIVQKLK